MRIYANMCICFFQKKKGVIWYLLIYHNEIMEFFLYIIIFITGTFFGSFFTLAVYRIPKREDILIKHSYCPNCNHKLGFFDLFPILSYVFLGGKCRYCKNKIRPRYLILEVLSGLTFLILALCIKLDINNFYSIINVVFLLIYASVLFIIAGIDKENIKVEKSVLLFGVIIETLYIIYQYTLCNINVYQYVMYFIAFLIAILIVKIIRKNEYITQNLFLLLYILFYSGMQIFILTVILSLIVILVSRILFKEGKKQTPIAFYLSACNILVIATLNAIINYI